MTPDRAALFAAYGRERRHVAPPGYRLEDFGTFVRYTPTRPGLEGFIAFTAIEAADLDAVIAAQADHFAAAGCDWEWKVYDFDRPADLAERLRAAAFAASPREAFMVYPTESHRSRPLRPGIRLARAGSPPDIRRVVEVQAAVWGEELTWLEAALTDAARTDVILLAFADGQPAGTGWINFTAGSDFADLHGGAVLPEFRGRGVYSALFDARAEEAQRRGVSYLAVDAAPMSRPILLRQGFHFICETTLFRRRRA